MALKSLLVHFDDSERCLRRLDIASRIAYEFAAQLVGVYLVPTPELTPTVASLLPDEIVEGELRATGAAQDLAEARFFDASQRANLVTIEWRAPAGDPVQAIAAHTRGVDLAVIGQPDPGDSTASFDESLVNSAVLFTGRPALVIPYNSMAGTVEKTALVAWDESKESARAVADSLPLLVKARRVIVVSIATSAEETDNQSQQAAHIDAYLRRHGVNAALRQLASHGDVGELLLSQASDVGADLIVMGAYGHTPLRELVLGGVTRSIIDSMTVPVLISH